jgi:hypothetical protein
MYLTGLGIGNSNAKRARLFDNEREDLFELGRRNCEHAHFMGEVVDHRTIRPRAFLNAWIFVTEATQTWISRGKRRVKREERWGLAALIGVVRGAELFDMRPRARVVRRQLSNNEVNCVTHL